MKFGDYFFNKLHKLFVLNTSNKLDFNLIRHDNFIEKLHSGEIRTSITPFLEDIHPDDESLDLNGRGISIFKPDHFFTSNFIRELRTTVENTVSKLSISSISSTDSNYYMLRSSSHPKMVIRDTDADKGMIDIFNFELALNKEQKNTLVTFAHKIEKKINQSLRKEVHFRGFNAYVSKGVTQTRGPHIDNHFGSIKAFIYLSECNDFDQGPHVYFPWSHSFFQRPSLLFKSYIEKNFVSYTDISLEALANSQFTGRYIFGDPGTVFISNQSGIHFGFPQSPSGKRVVLVANFD
jgi:hypothetical protein